MYQLAWSGTFNGFGNILTDSCSLSVLGHRKTCMAFHPSTNPELDVYGRQTEILLLFLHLNTSSIIVNKQLTTIYYHVHEEGDIFVDVPYALLDLHHAFYFFYFFTSMCTLLHIVIHTCQHKLLFNAFSDAIRSSRCQKL